LTGVTATAIDAAASRVSLDDGRELRYDRLLLTTGAEPRRISIPGADLHGVYYLRTLADGDALKQRLETGGHVVVVGAGWIGSEFAASARQRGLEVTVIDPLPLPNERVFGSEIGSFYRDVHAQHGVELLLGEGVDAFEGEEAVAGTREQWQDDRLRLRRGRHRRRAARPTGAQRWPRGRKRHRRGRELAELGAERVRRRGRRHRLACDL
jgi:3-phenylpropionate/trans-cinnamate dioxygenase ferredoxin reductase subunit